MKKYNVIGALLLLGFGIGVGWEAWKLGIGTVSQPEAGFFPFWSGTALVLFTGVLAIKSLCRTETKSSGDRTFWQDIAWGKILLVVVALLVYAFLLEPIGYLITTTLIMIFLFMAIEPQRWYKAVAWSVAVSVLTYALFKVWLQVQLPIGLWGI
jgi:putative tricarboxylic transport membrane protein